MFLLADKHKLSSKTMFSEIDFPEKQVSLNSKGAYPQLMNVVTLENIDVIMNELCLRFDDGVEVFLPLEMLRRACPCAHCQGEPDALGRVVKPVVEYTPQAFLLRSIERIGGYALRPIWGDGHATGIYSLGYLRDLAKFV
jgi:DUF971 family protein